MPKKTIFQIKFALEEIFVNIVSYGFSDDRPHKIKVSFSTQNGMLIMRLEDDGIPFNPLDAQSPDVSCPLEERQVGGLGIHLTRRLMNNVTYQRRGEKNVLIMKKQIAAC